MPNKNMLDISQVRLGTVVKVKDAPYVIIRAAQKQVGRGGSIKVLKMKNLINGSVLEKTIQGNDKMEEADLERGKASYLYTEGNESYFMDSESYEQFSLDKENIESSMKYLIESTDVDIVRFEGKPVSIQIPTKVTLTVTDAPPGIKGDTAGSASKQVTLETGHKINAPLFIKEGDKIVINTENDTYVERA